MGASDWFGSFRAIGRPRRRPRRLDFNSFGDDQRIFKLDAEVSDSPLHLGMSQPELDRPQVAWFLVDLRDLGAPHRVRAIGASLQTNGCHPVTYNPRLLAGRDVKPFVKTTRPEIFGSGHQWRPHPPCQRGTGDLGDFEADGRATVGKSQLLQTSPLTGRAAASLGIGERQLVAVSDCHSLALGKNAASASMAAVSPKCNFFETP